MEDWEDRKGPICFLSLHDPRVVALDGDRPAEEVVDAAMAALSAVIA